MAINTNQVPYLRTSRSFPADIDQISLEVEKAYIDTANCVNQRVIGIFTVVKPTITGETWFYGNNEKHQGVRQLFTFTTLAPINHNINFINVNRMGRTYGEYTDGTNWYGLVPGYTVAIPGQISFYVTPTQIIFVSGAGALIPGPLFKGNLVLEWLSNV